MLKYCIILFVLMGVYYNNTVSYTIETSKYMTEDENYKLTPNEIELEKNDLNIIVTDYYNELNSIILTSEKIIPIEVFYDNDGLSFSKTIYECLDYYNENNHEIMKIKHVKIIVINSFKKSYCIMSTEL